MGKRKVAKKAAKQAKPALPPLSDAQLEVMKIIWAQEQSTVTQVWQELCSQREVARNTVLTVMDRLVKRGWLSKSADGNALLYSATVDEKKTMGQVVQKMVETAFSGAADEMIVALLDGRGVSDEEAARINKLIKAKRSKDKKN